MQHRLALCIGNSAYLCAPLTNPVNDATDFAAYLHDRLAFEATVECNAGKHGMESAFERLLSDIRPGSVVVMLFSGHACEVDGTNYLLPILDCGAMSDADLRYRGVSAQWMQAKVWERQPAFLLFILDCCRNNPYRGFKSAGGSGLAQMDRLGSLLLYACAPGLVALDCVGQSNNSPLITHLMQHLHVGEVHSAMRRVTREVYKSTNRRQHPWTHSDMMDEFYWHPPETSNERQLLSHVHSSEPTSSPPSVPLAVGVGEDDVLNSLSTHVERRDVESIVALMQQHPSVGEVQLRAILSLVELAAVDSAMRERIVSAGGMDCVVAALLTHSSHLGLADDKHQWVVSVGAIELILATMQSNPSNGAVQQSACTALYELAEYEPTRQHIINAGGVDRVMEAVNTHLQATGIRESGLRLLSRFARDETTYERIVQQGGLALFEGSGMQLDRPTSGDNLTQQSSSHVHSSEPTSSPPGVPLAVGVGEDDVLNSLSTHVERRDVESIVALMQQHPSVGEVQLRAILSLVELAAVDSAMRERIVSAGGMDCVVAALLTHSSHLGLADDKHQWVVSVGAIELILATMQSNPSNGAVQQSACTALYELAEYEPTRQHIINAGGVDRVMEAVNTHLQATGIRESGLRLLSRFARDETTYERIVQQGGLALFEGSGMQLDRPTSGDNLTQQSSSHVHSSEPTSSPPGVPLAVGVGEDDVLNSLSTHVERRDVESIVALMQQHPSVGEVQLRAILSLVELAAVDSAMRERIVSAGGMDCVVAALLTHSSHLGLADDKHQWVVSVGAIELILATMQSNPSNGAVQQSACTALYELAEYEPTRQHIINAGGVDRVMEAVNTHLQATGIRESGLRLLSRFARDETTYERIVQQGGLALFEGSGMELSTTYRIAPRKQTVTERLRSCLLM